MRSVGIRATVGGDVLQDRLFAQVELDDLRNVRIGRLVVGDAISNGVGQRDPAGSVNAHQARHAEHAVGSEGERIETVVVHASVDDVDPSRTLGGAHPHRVVVDHEVLAFDQLDPHLSAKNVCSK